jgi:hypothetical protein
MATQLLNVKAEVLTIQDLLGHRGISKAEGYGTLSNIKTMAMMMQRTSRGHTKEHKILTPNATLAICWSIRVSFSSDESERMPWMPDP